MIYYSELDKEMRLQLTKSDSHKTRVILSCQHVHPILCNEDGMFKLSGSAPVCRDCRPSVFQNYKLVSALRQCWLDGERLASLHSPGI